MSGIGAVGDGMGMGMKNSKDDPMQLSDILPKTLMYDKMRPPKVEGDATNSLLNTTLLSQMLNLNKTCKVSLKCRKYKVLRNNLATFLKLQKSFQSEQILFSSIFNIFFSGRWDFYFKVLTAELCDNIVLFDV